MIRAEILDALGIPRDADDVETARRFRRLIGLPLEGSADPALWKHFLDEIEGALRFPGGDKGDGADLANNVVGCSIALPGDPEEGRRGVAAWDRELGVGFAESDDVLRELVLDEIAPRLAHAGLYRLL